MHSDGAAARGVGRVVSARGVADTSEGVRERHAVTVLLWQVRRLVSPHRRADLSRRQGPRTLRRNKAENKLSPVSATTATATGSRDNAQS